MHVQCVAVFLYPVLLASGNVTLTPVEFSHLCILAVQAVHMLLTKFHFLLMLRSSLLLITAVVFYQLTQQTKCASKDRWLGQ